VPGCQPYAPIKVVGESDQSSAPRGTKSSRIYFVLDRQTETSGTIARKQEVMLLRGLHRRILIRAVPHLHMISKICHDCIPTDFDKRYGPVGPSWSL
jgi:hypothetical protein